MGTEYKQGGKIQETLDKEEFSKTPQPIEHVDNYDSDDF